MKSSDLVFQLPDGTLVGEDLFSDVDLSIPQDTETHEVQLVNRHERDTLLAARVWVETLDAPIVLSTDGSAWWPAHNETLSVGLGDLGPGQAGRFYIRRETGGDPTAHTAWLRAGGMVTVR